MLQIVSQTLLLLSSLMCTQLGIRALTYPICICICIGDLMCSQISLKIYWKYWWKICLAVYRDERFVQGLQGNIRCVCKKNVYSYWFILYSRSFINRWGIFLSYKSPRQVRNNECKRPRVSTSFKLLIRGCQKYINICINTRCIAF